MKAVEKYPATKRIHRSALGKCTALWNASRRPKSSEIIDEYLESKLLYPCPTRWNSLFDAISRLLKFSSKLNVLLEKLNINSSFKDSEIEYLKEYCVIMKPIATALDYLQGDQNCFYGQLWTGL